MSVHEASHEARSNTTPKRTRQIGRRPGSPGTKSAILLAARKFFADRGYDGASLRAIAAEAQVDPALLIHYFGNKESLFSMALGLSTRPSARFGNVPSHDLPAAARAIARGFLEVIDDEESGQALHALVRSAVSNENAAALLREFLATEILSAMGHVSHRSNGTMAASLAAAQLVGIAMLRNVVKVEPLASANSEDVVKLVAPTIEHYLQ